jgi:hypothetical protein
LKELRRIPQDLTRKSWSKEQDLKFKLPKYGTEVLTTRGWRLGISDEIDVKMIAYSEVLSFAKLRETKST